MRHAVVSVASPLKVRFDDATTDTPVDQKGSHVPSLAVNDEVMVDLVVWGRSSRVVVAYKLVSA